MASVFDTIKQRAGNADKSATWYRTQVNKIASNKTAGQLFRENKLNGRPSVGRLNLFGIILNLERLYHIMMCSHLFYH